MKQVVQNERGVLHLPLALVFLAILIFSFGAWGLLRHWRHLAELQLRLDECAGRKALALRASMNRIETENAAMTATRASLAAAWWNPPVAAGLRTTLQVQAGLEKAERVRWEVNQATWLMARGCGGSGDVAPPMPDFPWSEVPPDPLGPRPLRFNPGVFALHIQVDHPPRHAAAVVNSLASTGGLVGIGKWQAHWAKPEAGAGSLARVAGMGSLWPSGPGLH